MNTFYMTQVHILHDTFYMTCTHSTWHMHTFYTTHAHILHNTGTNSTWHRYKFYTTQVHILHDTGTHWNNGDNLEPYLILCDNWETWIWTLSEFSSSSWIDVEMVEDHHQRHPKGNKVRHIIIRDILQEIKSGISSETSYRKLSQTYHHQRHPTGNKVRHIIIRDILQEIKSDISSSETSYRK